MYFCPFCGTLLLLEKPDAFRFYCTACSYRLPVPSLSNGDLRSLAKANRPSSSHRATLQRSATTAVKREPDEEDDELDNEEELSLFGGGRGGALQNDQNFAPLTISHREQFVPFHKQPEDSFFQSQTVAAEGSQITTVRCESAANGVYRTVPARSSTTGSAEDSMCGGYLKEEDLIPSSSSANSKNKKTANVKMETRECDSNKAYFVQLQMRSADEPPTTFFKCVVCGFQWRSD